MPRFCKTEIVLISGISYTHSFNRFQKRIGVDIQPGKDRFEVDVLLLRLGIMAVLGQHHQITVVPLYNIHIALVAHPRKTINFLRLMDISGSANISNLVDAAFIIHRVNHDFKRGYMAEFCGPKAKEDEIPLFNATNVIEIAKDRETGIQDEFIPLWYETESRRMLNEKTEVIKFKWTTEWAESEQENEFMELAEGDIPFE